MSLFHSRKKFTISARDSTYKVRYLGNVQTALMKGEGCVDKATAALWNNLVRHSNVGIDMKLTVTASGLKAVTAQQGLTEYRAHRISYCIAHPDYPKLFVWVYRHEGRRMRVELRCHAALCSSDAKSKAMAVQLHDKLATALREFMRDKSRKQTSRLTMQKTSRLPGSPTGLPLRTRMLSTGQNFKPPIEKSASAPRLGNISEDPEPEEEEYRVSNHVLLCRQRSSAPVEEALDLDALQLEMGNDIDELKRDRGVQHILNHLDDWDDNSSESGFSEQDREEGDSGGCGSSGGSSGSSGGSSGGGGGGGGGGSSGAGRRDTQSDMTAVVSALGRANIHGTFYEDDGEEPAYITSAL